MAYNRRLEFIDILKVTILVLGIITITSNMAFAQRHEKTDTTLLLSPFDFGLAEAETDSARYEVLYATHTKAVELGADVSYQGIGTLVIEVTESSLPIPLTRHNDFAGVHLIVKNQHKAQYLFSMADTLWQSVELSPAAVDSGNFSSIPSLAEGTCMLLLEDLQPWVNNRSGYKYGAMRKDLLLLYNGQAQNKPVSAYATDSTILKASVHPTDNTLKTITDLTITRDTSATTKTFCFYIHGINNLKISKLRINTPDTKNLYADAAINIENCTNIALEDVTIQNGTLDKEAKLLSQRKRNIDQILYRMMKDSDNLYAESMYYQIAACSDQPAKALYAQRLERALMERAGLNSSNYRLADGSGLSLYNYLSAECLLRLLRYAYKHKRIYDHLLASLPIAGEDGTLKKRMKETFAEGNVRAKTGTLTGIISLAGYCTASNGHRLCFAIINQGVQRSRDGRDYQDKICNIICE